MIIPQTLPSPCLYTYRMGLLTGALFFIFSLSPGQQLILSGLHLKLFYLGQGNQQIKLTAEKRVRHRSFSDVTITSSLQSYWILFSTYFRYSFGGRKFKHTENFSSVRLHTQDTSKLARKEDGRFINFNPMAQLNL